MYTGTFFLPASSRTRIRSHTAGSYYGVHEETSTDKDLTLNAESVHHVDQCQMQRPKTFASDDLEKFYRVQESESYFVCTLCEKSFRTKSGLKSHVEKHTGTEKYRCVICSKSFVHFQHYNGHMASHDPSKMVHCKYCHKFFTFKSNRDRHEKKCKEANMIII